LVSSISFVGKASACNDNDNEKQSFLEINIIHPTCLDPNVSFEIC
jgi:hypothetical protein